MKKLLLSACTLCAALSLSAQTKVENPALVDANYDRNSLTIIAVDRDDKFDQVVLDAVQSINSGDKFDKNVIPTKSIEVDSVRTSASGINAINSIVLDSKIGNQIVKSWFTDGSSDMMSGQRVERRGRYNANDQDVADAKSAKIGEAAMKDSGYALINKSYLIVMDNYNFEESETEHTETTNILTGEKKTVVTPSISATSTLYVYKIDFSEELQNEFYEKCWIDETTPKSEIEAKRAAFKAFKVPLKAITSATSSASAEYETKGNSAERDEALTKAIQSSYFNAVSNLEKAIEEWKIKVSVQSVRPLGAKAGTKEGIRNRDRFMAYETKVKKVDGKETTVSVKKGYVRATEVANNSANADGKTPMTKFYQISHVQNIKMGQILKQSNDLGMGVGLAYNVSKLYTATLSLDYLMDIKTNGTSTYTLIDIGYDILSAKKMEKNDLLATGIYEDGISFIGIALGYGYGFRPGLRSIEIVPAISIGGDYMSPNADIDDEESDSKMMKKMGWYGRVGAKVNITAAYPLQVYAGVDYSLFVYEGDWYKTNNATLKEHNLDRKSGLSLSVGVKYVF
ncbi:MAG: hypothetical protein R3Y08_03805 [Rikenellaceae bacterium]